MNLRNTTYIVILLLLFLAACAKNTSVSWFSWNEVESKLELDDRKVLVWVHDDTCSTCVEAESRIFTPKNIEYINQYFHAIKLGVHSQKTITTKGKTYKYIQNLEGGGYHELAVAITQSKEKIAYPALVFLDNKMDLIAPLKGNIEEDELALLLNYVEGDHFMNTDIESYKQVAFK